MNKAQQLPPWFAVEFLSALVDSPHEWAKGSTRWLSDAMRACENFDHVDRPSVRFTYCEWVEARRPVGSARMLRLLKILNDGADRAQGGGE